ncbi:MAG: PAS domain S-box protein [Desulfomonile tiedjei]|uniref:histidine kinase n=1 Tax=Desulfomonile tiedjei TaxID=2358 RepID=A0A9D6UZT1_9BACT|nr:PAS domain S-box protein [Desulfomonile tiedjei]
MKPDSTNIPRTSSESREDSQSPLTSGSPTPGLLLRWLKKETAPIIEEWVETLSVLSQFYAKRPREELIETVSEAFHANLEFLSLNRLTRIQQFIDYITEKRLAAGFPLSDVQRAFELFRLIVTRKLLAERSLNLLAQSVDAINACLSYTIHRFSEHFQHMHERSIRQHAQDLEQEISMRTAELAESERKYKTLVEEINDGYFVIQNARIIFANQAFCRMHGTTPGQVEGQPFLRFVAPEWRERLRAAYLDAPSGRLVASTIEYARLGCDPEKGATEIKAKTVDLGKGLVTIGMCRDISERVAMERKVRENERLAYVGHLAASLSHEIRNPLSSINMNLQILSDTLQLDGFDKRRLDITVREVSRLENILRQLLDLSRPVSIELGIVDVHELVQGCVDLVEPKTAEKHLKIVQRYARSLSPCRLDAKRLQQALLNLMLNAIEVTDEGRRILVFVKTIRVGKNEFLEVGVRDSGPGVDPAAVSRLFDPFYTTKAQGSGLGLSNVKRIVEAHQGNVEVRNHKGPGATFVMRLPWKV